MNGLTMTFSEGWEGLYGTLPVHEINSDEILQVEDTTSKDTFERSVGLTKTRRDIIRSIREILDNNGTLDTDPIVTIVEPNISEELLMNGFHKHMDIFFNEEKENISKDEIVAEYKKLRKEYGKILLCYNGNTRLDAHQKSKKKVKTYIIKSNDDVYGIPEHEKIHDTQFQNYEFIFYYLLIDVLKRRVRSWKLEKFTYSRQTSGK